MNKKTPSPSSSPKKLSKRKKLGIFLLSTLVLYTLLGFIILPKVVLSQAPKQVKEILHRDLSIEKLSFNPYSFKVQIEKLHLQKEDRKPLVAFDSLLVNFQLSSLFTLSANFKEIHLHGLKIHAGILADGKLTIDDLLTDEKAQEPSPKDSTSQGSLFPLNIQSLKVADAGLFFLDQSQGKSKSISLDPINFSVQDFSTRIGRGENNQYDLHLQSPDGGEFHWNGNFQLSPFQSSGKMLIQNADLTEFKDFYQEFLPYELRSLFFTFQTEYQISSDPSLALELINSDISIDSLKLAQPNAQNSFFQFGSLHFNGMKLNTQQRTFHLDSIDLSNLHIELLRQNSGELNILTALNDWQSKQPPQDTLKKETPPDSLTQHLTNFNQWKWGIDHIHIHSPQIQLQDAAVIGSPATHQIKELQVTISNLQKDTEVNTQISALINGGSLKLENNTQLFPLKNQGKLSLTQIPLTGGNPYLNEHLNGLLTDGKLNLELDFLQQIQDTVRQQEEALSVQGNLSINDFNLAQQNGSEIFKWQQLSLRGIQSNLLKNATQINAITLKNPSLTLSKNQSGELNLNQLLKNNTVENNPPQKVSNSPKPAVKIQNIQLQNFNVAWTDRSISPSFKTSLKKFSGNLGPVSLLPYQTSKFQFKGKIDGNSDLSLQGQGKFLAPKPQLSFSFKTTGQDMVSFTPYSGNHAGYEIAKGLLNTDLQYQIAQDTIAGKNQIQVQKLKFGKSVESENAVTFPIKLGVALISDQDDNINLDVDVKGSLSDPEFSLAGVLWDAVKNILINVAASPFTSIMALVGSDENIESIAFPPGSYQLQQIDKENLKNLANGLNLKPEINIEIDGTFHPTEDLRILKEIAVLSKLSKSYSQKHPTLKDSLTTHTLAENPQHQKWVIDYARGNETLSNHSKKLLPQDSLSTPIDSSQQRIQLCQASFQLLMEKESITQETLEDLAMQRAQSVKATLTEAGLSPQRIFLLNLPNTDQNSTGAKLSMRVD